MHTHALIHGYLSLCGRIPIGKISLLSLANESLYCIVILNRCSLSLKKSIFTHSFTASIYHEAILRGIPPQREMQSNNPVQPQRAQLASLRITIYRVTRSLTLLSIFPQLTLGSPGTFQIWQ